MEEILFAQPGARHSGKEKPETVFDTADAAFAAATLVCGFLYWNLIDFYLPGAGVTVFAAVLFAVSFAYLAKSGYRQSAGSLACLALAGLSALQFALFDNRFVSGLNFIFLTAMFVYWICLSTGRRIDNKLSIYILGDAVKQGLCMPFLNFGCCAAGLKMGVFRQKRGKGALAALVGVLVFLPLIVAVVSLLASADLAFENFVAGVFDIASVEKIITYVGQFIFGIPVAFYLYGLIYGNVKGRHVDKFTAKSLDSAAETMRIAPGATIYSGLTAFNVIYAVFFAVQAAYLFSAFNGSLPEAFTYAEYARRGFFELCAVAGINLGVLAIAHLTIKRAGGGEPMALRVQTVSISLFTVLLIVTALSKMAMYINAYGLTQLRVFTSWFMALLLFVFLTICVRQFKKFNSARLIIAGFVVMFMILTYGNADGFIAKSNIDRYEAGALAAFDIGAAAELSDAAVPQLYGLYLKTDEGDFETRQMLEAAIMGGAAHRDGFRAFNLQRHRADGIRKNIGADNDFIDKTI